jgi:hypothetical protein
MLIGHISLVREAKENDDTKGSNFALTASSKKKKVRIYICQP